MNSVTDVEIFETAFKFEYIPVSILLLFFDKNVFNWKRLKTTTFFNYTNDLSVLLRIVYLKRTLLLGMETGDFSSLVFNPRYKRKINTSNPL